MILQASSTPSCPKCAGLIVLDGAPDMTTGQELQFLRCVCCGFRTDPVMEANRLRDSQIISGRRTTKDKAQLNQSPIMVRVAG